MKFYKGILLLFKLICLLGFVLGSGEINILHSPDGINFHGKDLVNSSELPQILAAAMGYSTIMNNPWKGLVVTNPFNYPKSTIVIEVDNLSSSKELGSEIFPVNTNISPKKVLKLLSSDLDGPVFGLNDLFVVTLQEEPKIKLKKLDAKNEAVDYFIRDIRALYKLNQVVIQKKKIHQAWITLSSMGSLIEEYGDNSVEVNEAMGILKSALNELENSLQSVYGDKFLLVVFASDQAHDRRVRSASNDKFENLNLSKRYGDDYAAIFNIILWMSVFLIAALIATSVFICTLDPGRDSIIYRMTAQRIKKDN